MLLVLGSQQNRQDNIKIQRSPLMSKICHHFKRSTLVHGDASINFNIASKLVNPLTSLAPPMFCIKLIIKLTQSNINWLQNLYAKVNALALY